MSTRALRGTEADDAPGCGRLLAHAGVGAVVEVDEGGDTELLALDGVAFSEPADAEPEGGAEAKDGGDDDAGDDGRAYGRVLIGVVACGESEAGGHFVGEVRVGSETRVVACSESEEVGM